MQVILKSGEAASQREEEQIISELKPKFNYVCSNPVRAGILHMMLKASDTDHTLQVEELAERLGKRHSMIIYHLEQLENWKLVSVVVNNKYGSKHKRSIWGLNKKYPNLLLKIYAHMLKTFYTQRELDKVCSVNKNLRKTG